MKFWAGLQTGLKLLALFGAVALTLWQFPAYTPALSDGGATASSLLSPSAEAH